MTMNDIVASSVLELPNFWGGGAELDVTMLRTVQCCQIAGFDLWWQRWARETREDVFAGCYGGDISGALWLFAMCRSDLALSMLPTALRHVFDTVVNSRIRAPLPWQDPDARTAASIPSDHIPCASAIVFAEHRLQLVSGLKVEAIETIQYHYQDGAWPIWTSTAKPSIEATAMAVHALALTRSQGWEHTVAGASSWLLSAQHEDGYWDEEGALDSVYLTVLVMDALSLAAQPPGPVTFGHGPFVMSSQSEVFADSPNAPGLTQAVRPEPASLDLTTADSALKTGVNSAPGPSITTCETGDAGAALDTADQRRGAVDAYIDEVFKKTGKRITRTDIWKEAAYTDATQFERWQRNDPNNTCKAHRKFSRILTQKPHLQ